MIEYLKHIGVIILLTFEFSSSINLTGLFDPNNPNEPSIVLPFVKKRNLRLEGIFERFLRNLLELLTTTFPERNLQKYCRILSRCINQLDYRHAKKLAKHLRKMSRMYPDELKNELIMYKQELETKRQYQTDFLEAMDNIFTLQEHIRFDDYIYDLRNYGTGDILFIDKETEKLVTDVIMKSLMRQSSKDRSELMKKLRNAVKEFNKWNLK